MQRRGLTLSSNLQRRALPLSSDIPPRLRRSKSKVQFRRNLTYIFDVLANFPEKKLPLVESLMFLSCFDIVHAKAGVDCEALWM